MKPHGDYKIKVSGNIVHTFPVGGFNSEGIEELHKDILAKAPKNSWVLFEHPFNTAGLTPEAVDEIVRSYQCFETNRCLAIALELSSTWQRLFETSIVEHLNIPVYLGSSGESLEHKLVEKLSENT
ncbi:hypothetical protein [Alteromonas sp. KUL49]|uniref:hypothetical protein n=1 Tax=Alteromonas sp. KUL49 TaxID=2480798 RepID=UPI00102EDE97|nr:hypothetical protein [Alteromonas sp. KUL49]TAP40943.1 hypothetical protein EYS00_07505 [Alteromonas sp. KUL49]GEA11125.1 hypothetical protein KUL49_15000 [Alteromonas sp. KUL49]